MTEPAGLGLAVTGGRQHGQQRHRTRATRTSEPIESRRTPAATDVGGVIAGRGASREDGRRLGARRARTMGEFSAEAARPTPLDDIAEVERRKAPRD